MNQQKTSFVTRGARKPGTTTWISRITTTALSAGLALTGLTVAAPTALAVSTGCTSFNGYEDLLDKTSHNWMQINGGFVFEEGETVTATFSNPDTEGTVHIYAGSSAAPGQPAVYESKASSSSFPATLSFTLDQDYTLVMIGDATGGVATDMTDLTCEVEAPSPEPEVGTSIALLPQTITLTPTADQDLADASVEVTATASSGLEVTIASAATSVCTVSGTTITLIAAGECSITADQAGDSNYQPASTVIDAFTITEEVTTAEVSAETPNPPANPSSPTPEPTAPAVSTPDTQPQTTPKQPETETQPDTTPAPEQPIKTQTAASYFQKGNAKFHAQGIKKLDQLLATNPETLSAIAVSNTRASHKANKRVAKKRAQAIQARAAQIAPNTIITTEVCPAKRKGGQMPREDRVVRSQKGKPLTTITVTYK